jgi:hypothetical protein
MQARPLALTLLTLALVALPAPSSAQFTDDSFDGTTAGSVGQLYAPNECTSPGVPTGCITYSYITDGGADQPMDRTSDTDFGYFMRARTCGGSQNDCTNGQARCVLGIDFYSKLVNTVTQTFCQAVVAGSTFYASTPSGYYSSGDGGISFGALQTINGAGSSSRMGKDDSNNVIWYTIQAAVKFYPGAATANLAVYQPSSTNIQGFKGPAMSVGPGGSGDWVIAANYIGLTRFWYTSDNYATGAQYDAPTTCGAVRYYNGVLYCFFQFASSSSVHSTSNDLGVYTSTNFGSTWNSAKRIFIAPAGASFSPALASDHDGAVYVVGTHTLGSNKVFYAKTEDDGSTWTTYDLTTSPAPNTLLSGTVTRDGTLRVHYRTGSPNAGAVSYYLTASVGAGAATTTSTVISATGLIEGDLTADGIVVMARTDSGDTVATWNAQSGDSLGTDATPNCGYAGVSASYTFANGYHVTYGDCAAGGAVETLKVRNQFFEDPDTDCLDGSEDHPQLAGDGEFDIPFDQNELNGLDAAPYYGTTATRGSDSVSYCYLGWTFSTLSGEIGAVGVVYNSFSETPEGDRTLVTVSSGDVVDDFCSWRDPTNDRDYVAGVVLGGPTVAARILTDIQPGSNPTFGSDPPDMDLSNTIVFSNSGSLGDSVAIECAKNQAIVKRDSASTVNFINVTNEDGSICVLSCQLWSTSVGDSYQRSVAFSKDGAFVAYRDGDEIVVAYSQNGTEVTTLEVPTGTWVSMKLDGTASNLAVFTSTQITVYHIATETCGEDCNLGSDDFHIPPTSTTTSTATGSNTCSILCTDSATVPEGFTVGGFNALLGVLLMAGVGGGFYFIDTKSRYSVLFGCIGAAVGFFLAYSFGLFPLWLILLGVLVVAAVLVMRFRGGL